MTISESKYYQIKKAVKHQIFGNDMNAYNHFVGSQQVSDLPQTIIYARYLAAKYGL